MNFIDTPWEKRNLGVESGKVIVQSDNDVALLKETLKINNKEYMEADVAPGCIKSIRALENSGFHFMETLVELEASVSEIVVPKNMKRFAEKVSYDLSSEEELQIIKSVIRSGEMFLTDKISLNPFFGQIKAGNRYANWVESLLEKDARCFSVHYKDKLIGFEISILEDGKLEFLLGGGFPKTGAGMMTVTASYNYWTHQDIKSIETKVSSNNLPVLKLHELFGLRTSGLRYVFVKNIDN